MREALLEVYDLCGRKVCEQHGHGDAMSVITRDWPSGMYFWRLSGPSTMTKTGKWIKK